MEEIELTKRRSNASRAATSLKNVNVKEIDNDNSSLKSQPFYTGSNSVDDGNNNDNELEEINDLKPNRNTLRERLKFKTPAVPLIRMILKGSIALLISLLFVYVDNPRNKIGRASTMVVTSTILSFPFRPLGVQFEATVTGCLGAIGGAAWSFLGMYLGNLARDPNISSPVQPKSSAVLSIIMYIGVFIVTYARVKFAQAYWATVYSSMVIAFALTQASVTPGFAPVVVWTFTIPILLGNAIGLVVDVLLWPADSITKYLGVLNRSLKSYTGFLDENVNAFFTPQETDKLYTLPSIHTRLQNTVLNLVDSKREIQRELLINRLSHEDIADITRVVKGFRVPLHGIGLSLIAKNEYYSDLGMTRSINSVQAEAMKDENVNQFFASLDELRAVSQELTQACISALNECNERLMKYCNKPRTTLNSFLWPFPRIFITDYIPNSTEAFTTVPYSEENFSCPPKLSKKLEDAIQRYEKRYCKSRIFVQSGSVKFEERFEGMLKIIYLFQFNLMQLAQQLQMFALCIEKIEITREKRKIWFPRLRFYKWFRSSNADANLGGQIDIASNPTDNHNSQMEGGNNYTLGCTMTKRDIDLVDNSDWIKGRNKTGTLYSRDPDVDPPATLIERFWYGLYKIVKWIESEECIFAVKTAGGFVLLSLPAYLPQSAGWFFNWKGQWATITLMMWAIPLTGQFYFTVVLRVIATVIGGVMGIVIWEIVRGNPYGLTILTFVVMLPVYHIFFTREVLRMGTIMVQITLVLVTCYEYQGVASGTATDSVESVAGKRILLVVIGVAAAAVLAWLPKSITGRVALRKRISQTLHDMSKLYGLLVGDILHTMTDSEPTTNQLKAFRKLAYDIRRQIADERTYLKLTRLEPPLRGKFPYKIYATLVEKIDNMSDLLQGMGFSTRHTDKAWKRSIVKVIHEERMQYIAFVLTTLKLLSTALVSKISLPPYMIRPRQMRRKLNERLSSVIRECPEHMDSDSFPSYCAFAVCSFKFAEELEEVIDCVEKLVGVEDPEKWLLINA